MNIRRSWFFFLMMLLLSVCGVLLLAEEPVTDAWNEVRGVSHGSWQIVGTGPSDVAAAAGWEDGALALRFFTPEGAALSAQSAEFPDGLDGGTVSRILPLRDGLAYLGIYGPNAQELYLYRVGGSEGAERLLAIPCEGETCQERIRRTAFSEFSCENGIVSLAVRIDGVLERYICRETGGVESAGETACGTDNILSVLAERNGTILLGGTDNLAINGRELGGLVDGQTIICLTQGRGGWYYIDAAGIDVRFVDAAGSMSQQMFRLDSALSGSVLTSAALTRDERAVLLLDGSRIVTVDAQGARELAGILRPTQTRSVLTLAKYAGLALLAALALWFVLCGARRGYASLVVFRGGTLIAVALLCFVAVTRGWLAPALREESIRENAAIVGGVLRTAERNRNADDTKFAESVSQMLESADSGRNVRTVIARRDGTNWRTSDGRRAETVDGFSAAIADEAMRMGRATELRDGTFRYAVSKIGTEVALVYAEDVFETDAAAMFRLLLEVFAILTLVALLCLTSISVDIRRLSGKMERISRGGAAERLELHTGDELESMASIVNSLDRSLKERAEDQEILERSYRRFVPEKVLALLGKQSIRDVDKSTFAARRMEVMSVGFTFPEEVYTNTENSRLLFDSVNEVIERTASIVARKGGTVFHFAYNGFDVVMEESGEAISTAVAIQQEVLSLNERRSQNRLPPVTLHIALDVGDVMLGIVGDSSQMEPTTISSSLSVVQELMSLCTRLRAGILCTEAVILEKQEYGNRYMGKCIVGDQPVRVYEVFDGDEFNVRRGKTASMRDFSQGVYDLYSGDAAGAKHVFLQLAHNYPFDGGARYYLYLADRLEHDPSLACVLNVDAAEAPGGI